MLPHIIFPSQIPTSWKVIKFLILFHGLKCLKMSATHIKEYIPIWSFSLGESIELKWIHDAFILWSCNFIGEIGLFNGNDPVGNILVKSTAFRILKEDSGRSILKSRLEHIGISLILSDIRILLTIHINGVIQLLIIHENTFHGFLAIGSYESWWVVHAFWFY